MSTKSNRAVLRMVCWLVWAVVPLFLPWQAAEAAAGEMSDKDKEMRRWQCHAKYKTDQARYLQCIGQGERKAQPPAPKVSPKPPIDDLCKPDLNAYEQELRKQMLSLLLDSASKRVFDDLKRVAQDFGEGGRWLMREWKIKTDRYADLLAGLVKPPPSPFERFEQAFRRATIVPGTRAEELPVWKVVREVGENATKGMAAVEATLAAIDGAYSEAAATVIIEAIGSYSNAAGLAIAAAQAVKADWDAFQERYYEKEFRELYVKIYYQGGGRPAEARWREGRPARLRAFVEEVYDWLDYGGLQGDRLRKLLIDHAAYKLELRLSRSDFRLVETEEGARRFANPTANAVLGSLFLAFEQVFEKDAEAELLRRIVARQTRKLGERAGKAEDALTRAAEGDFAGVWPDAKERQNQFCKAAEQVRTAKGAAVRKD